MLRWRKEHVEKKSLYLALKLGIKHCCNECDVEIFQMDDGRWMHNLDGEQYIHCRVPQDRYNPVATPMTESDLIDMFEEIQDDEWLLDDENI